MTVWVSNFLTLIVIVKIGCMVTMGNSSSSSSSRLSRDESYYDDDNNIPVDVSISCIKNHLRSGIPAQEFMRLEHNAPGIGDTLTEAQRICNKEKNRYVNILPCDSTRVRLAPIAGVDGSDYINANFIDGVTDRAYIATQGPLPHTRGDFWRMVWENSSTIVVMLGKEKENERVKVDRYWPEEGEGSLHFSGLKVTLVDKRYDQELGIAVRRLRITRVNSHSSTLQHVHTNTNLVHSSSNQNINVNNNTNTNTHTNTNNTNHQNNNNNEQEFRDVIHYQYEGWPDHGVPDSAAPIRKLVRIIEQERALTISLYPWSPMVVHCSAGVGRTGTFITVHMTLLRLFQEMNAENSGQQQSLSHSTSSLSSSTRSSSNLSLDTKFNLYETVLKLRKQRPGMVQQQEQYIFCYEAVADEAEHQGLIPPSPVTPRRSPRTLSISTSSLPSPSSSSSTTLRTSSSSYLSSPTGLPPSPPDFLTSSSSSITTGQYFLNSSTASLPAPSPPSSPYIHNTALDCSTPSLFPPPVDCRKEKRKFI